MRFCIAILFLVSFCDPLIAWNALSHKVVAEIAWRQLTPEQRQPIVDALRRHPRFDSDFVSKMEESVEGADKETQDHWIFQHAATWPDLARSIGGEDQKAFDRPTWHYINFPLFVDESDRVALTGKLKANVSPDPSTTLDKSDYNILQAIAYCQSEINSRSASPSHRALAYCWLFHLVGDIHQPLHSSALYSVKQFPAGDRGGNKISLVRGENLHSLWDNLLGREYYMRNVTKAVAELSDRQKYGVPWNDALKESSPRAWANESHEICKSFVYSDIIMEAVRIAPDGAKLSPIKLPDSYYPAAGELARHRIVMAGARLGAMLGGSKVLPTPTAPTPLPPVNSFIPTQRTPNPSVGKASQAELTYWLTTSSGIRHNSSCRYYQKSAGHACSSTDGKPCKVCGG